MFSFSDFDYCNLDAKRQQRDTSCGFASLSAILQYFGKHVDEGLLLKQYKQQIPQYSASLEDLKMIALENDLSAFLYSMDYWDGERRCPLKSLVEMVMSGRPVLIPVRVPHYEFFGKRFPPFYRIYKWLNGKIGKKTNHFVVVMGLSKSKKDFLIMDPLWGYTIYSNKQLQKRWAPFSFVALVCFSSDSIEVERNILE